MLVEGPLWFPLAEAEDGDPRSRGDLVSESGKALLEHEEGLPQFDLRELAQIMVYNANLGAC